MPMGIHTVVTEGGSGLSSGQRQRLIIARALAGRPKILLFDEATSALDNRTQAHVSQSIHAQLGGTTRVAIAHRLSTVIDADRIYVLSGGKIVQSGRYSQLIAEPGPFRELARTADAFGSARACGGWEFESVSGTAVPSGRSGRAVADIKKRLRCAPA